MGSIPQAPIRFELRSTPSHLPVARAATEAAARLVGFADPCLHQIMLAVDEALANIIEHAYGGRADERIEVTLTPQTQAGRCIGLEVLLRDHGQAVDPADIRSRPLEELRPGGLGVHIMQSCMDEVEYSAAEGGGTLLRMLKRLPGQPSATKQGRTQP